MKMKFELAAAMMIVALLSGCTAFNHGAQQGEFERKGWVSVSSSEVRERIEIHGEFNRKVNNMLERYGMPDAYATFNDWEFYAYYDQGIVYSSKDFEHDLLSSDHYNKVRQNLPGWVVDGFDAVNNEVHYVVNNPNITFRWSTGIVEQASLGSNNKLISFRHQKSGELMVLKRSESYDQNSCAAFEYKTGIYLTVCADNTAFMTNNGSITDTATITTNINLNKVIGIEEVVASQVKGGSEDGETAVEAYDRLYKECMASDEVKSAYRVGYYSNLDKGETGAQKAGHAAEDAYKAECKTDAMNKVQLTNM
ncbi:hypothetical protein [Enterovibrio paralichthyis]|uniref:hypothetical protein n=1 Tax=Enterovibrio paralichthyis TaxID=2853805 RepID=UPI001C44C8F1|nr:hypothetical protein [Enterovibrio paralichthyis]MBV7299363.1 hypothetical protein [Enterovibrio paralichthyis]